MNRSGWAVTIAVVFLARGALLLVSKSQGLPDSATDVQIFLSQTATVLCMAQAVIAKRTRLAWAAIAILWFGLASARLYASAKATTVGTILGIEFVETVLLAIPGLTAAIYVARAKGQSARAEVIKGEGPA